MKRLATSHNSNKERETKDIMSGKTITSDSLQKGNKKLRSSQRNLERCKIKRNIHLVLRTYHKNKKKDLKLNRRHGQKWVRSSTLFFV